MSVLINALNNYVQNAQDPEANWALGWEYDQLGQTGAAVGFYLRAAEKTTDITLQYECLVRSALCLEKQKDRNDSERTTLQKAISLMPNRPEAYFLLSRMLERLQAWHDSYSYASLGLNFANCSPTPLRTDVEYPGYYGLLFERGVSAWWLGYCEESLAIMKDLEDNYVMDKAFVTAVRKNLATIS